MADVCVARDGKVQIVTTITKEGSEVSVPTMTLSGGEVVIGGDTHPASFKVICEEHTGLEVARDGTVDVRGGMIRRCADPREDDDVATAGWVKRALAEMSAEIQHLRSLVGEAQR